MKKLFFIGLILLSQATLGQNRPRLVVGLVVDQMRYDFLARYYDDFEEGGFKRLMSEGFVYRNAHYNYIPTKTGPGHSSIYTGTTPSKHGIIGNDWYVSSIGRTLNCVEDSLHTNVGGVSGGNVSPANLSASTVTDELQLYYLFKSKVIGISLKDRGAVIPAGHNPTGAYWYDLQSGEMITSTYYMSELPQWVKDYNKKKSAAKYLKQGWKLLRDPETYNESISDQNVYEAELARGLGTRFPYSFGKYKNDYSVIKYTPFNMTITRELGMKAIEAEELGQDTIPDFLTLSFSATDDIGHKYGPRSVEVQDTYLRLDLEIKQLLTYLDEQVGEGEYLVFLTSDHGSSDIPAYLKKNKMQAGYHHIGNIRSMLNDHLSAEFGEGKWVESIINEQVYMNKKLAVEKGVDFKNVKSKVVQLLMSEAYIMEAFDADVVALRMFTDPMLIRLQNGYHNKRSGDVLYTLKPHNLNSEYYRKGTDHRTPYTYDTHIPIIFFGASVPSGNSVRKVSITDIAPTLSMLLNISLPNAASGIPLEELFK